MDQVCKKCENECKSECNAVIVEQGGEWMEEQMRNIIQNWPFVGWPTCFENGAEKYHRNVHILLMLMLMKMAMVMVMMMMMKMLILLMMMILWGRTNEEHISGRRRPHCERGRSTPCCFYTSLTMMMMRTLLQIDVIIVMMIIMKYDMI